MSQNAGHSPAPKSSSTPVSAPIWITSHQCAHCQYAHLIAQDSEPIRGDSFAYLCPLSGLENTFKFDTAAAPWKRAPTTTPGGIRTRRVPQA